MSRLAVLACLGMTACTSFPNLDDRVTAAARNAPYPQLTPIGPATSPTAACTTCATDALLARAAALRARAARLRNTDI